MCRTMDWNGERQGIQARDSFDVHLAEKELVFILEARGSVAMFKAEKLHDLICI